MMLPIAHESAAAITSRNPAQRRRRAERELVPREHADPQRGDAGADHAVPRQPVVQPPRGQADREERLRLDHERRESRRHPELHAEEQQAELEHADRESVGDEHRPRHVRAAHEEHRRHRRAQEAQRGERERRHRVERPAHRHEREAPDHDDQENQDEVAKRQAGGHGTECGAGCGGRGRRQEDRRAWHSTGGVPGSDEVQRPLVRIPSRSRAMIDRWISLGPSTIR